MSTDNTFLPWTIKRVLKILANPVTIVSIGGPTIVNVASQRLLLQLHSIPDSDTYYGQLKKLASDKWAQSLVEFNVQYTVLIIAFVFLMIELAMIIYRSSTLSSNPINKVLDNLGKDRNMLIWIFLTIAFIITMFFVFTSGTLGSKEIINSYYTNMLNHNPNAIFHFPPVNAISILRLVVAVFGTILTLLLNNVMAKHILNAQEKI